MDRVNPDPYAGLATFIAVAESASFTAAAARLGVTPTAVSKAIRAMEARHGVPLFRRTTRSVALTEAGTAVFARLGPASAEIGEAFALLGQYRDRPSGTLRITAPRSALDLLRAVAPAYRKAHPHVTLELSIDESLVDLVASGYDAGIRLGEAVEKDMVAVRLTPEVAWSVVGAPRCFAKRARPRLPEDLIHHEAIRYRFPGSRSLHRWAFRRSRREFLVDVKGRLIVDDRTLLVDLAVAGEGLAFVADREVRTHVAAGRLDAMLQSYIPSNSGLFLYFPAGSQNQLKLRAFIDTMHRVIADADARLPRDGPARARKTARRA